MLTKQRYQELKKISCDIRLLVLETIMKKRGPHIGSCFSIIDILTVLYSEILTIDPQRPFDDNRDRFILSKGHAALAVYATLATKNFFDKTLLETYGQNDSLLAGHISKNLPGIEVSTGSLGHGLSIANGIAFAGKKDSKHYRVFTLLSDGECDEGSTWEAILFAGHHHLDNLVAIVDYNKWQSFGRTRDVMNLEPFIAKWQSCNWSAQEIDGHNLEIIYTACQKIPLEINKPTVFIAHTIKGKGLATMEDTLESHYRPPTQEEYQIIREGILHENDIH